MEKLLSTSGYRAIPVCQRSFCCLLGSGFSIPLSLLLLESLDPAHSKRYRHNLRKNL